jgi:thiol-disulfide isomerase/thioredoxin
MRLQRKALILGCCLALVCFLSALALAEAEPKAGQMVSIKFPKPMFDEDATYLGLPKAEEFTVKDLKAPFLLVEQFNTTCPHCMAQAPALNSLYEKVQSDPQLKGKLKIMAIGQGNDESAIKMWKAFHKVPFPLFPDPNSTFGKAINFSPYPVSVVLDKTGKIVWAHVGAFESADEALQGIKAAVK